MPSFSVEQSYLRFSERVWGPRFQSCLGLRQPSRLYVMQASIYTLQLDFKPYSVANVIVRHLRDYWTMEQIPCRLIVRSICRRDECANKATVILSPYCIKRKSSSLCQRNNEALIHSQMPVIYVMTKSLSSNWKMNKPFVVLVSHESTTTLTTCVPQSDMTVQASIRTFDIAFHRIQRDIRLSCLTSGPESPTLDPK